MAKANPGNIRSTRAGQRSFFRSGQQKASNKRRAKGTNRAPGERGIAARGFQRSGGGSRNSPPAQSGRSSGS